MRAMSNEKDLIVEISETDSFKKYKEILSKIDKFEISIFYGGVFLSLVLLVCALFGVIGMTTAIGSIAIVFVCAFLLKKGFSSKYQKIYDGEKKVFVENAYALLLKRNKVHPDLTPSSPCALCEVIELFQPCIAELNSKRLEAFMFAMDNAARTNTKGSAYEFLVSDSFKSDFEFYLPAVMALNKNKQ